MKIPADVSFTIRPARNGFIVETADDAALPHVFASLNAAVRFIDQQFYPDRAGDAPVNLESSEDQ